MQTTTTVIGQDEICDSFNFSFRMNIIEPDHWKLLMKTVWVIQRKHFEKTTTIS